MSLKDIRPGFREFVLAAPGVSAVASTRMYPVRLPQGTNGASIVYNRISGQGDHHMQGPSGLARIRMQVDTWSTDLDVATSLANLVKEAIDGYRGVMGSGEASVMVQGVFFESERDLPFDDVGKLYGVSRDYFINYEDR